MRLQIWICNYFYETPADYNIILPRVIFIHIQDSELLIDRPNSFEAYDQSDDHCHLNY